MGSFKDDFGALPPELKLTGLQSILAQFDADDETALQDPATLAAMCYVLANTVEYLLRKDLEHRG
jgi:hypothetical protein